MRTFIAIELPQEIKKHIASIQEKLRPCDADVKWVEPDNIHLTLKFLGEIDEDKVAAISEAMEGSANQRNPFVVSITSLGAFPKIDSPRVIWLGIEKGAIETQGLAAGLEEKLEKLGIPKEERPFSSHITIGRTRSARNIRKLAEALKTESQQLSTKGLLFETGRITLFKSALTPKGPVYQALKEADLKTT